MFHPQLYSLNAYIGAEPIFRALNEGAQIVVTGRCVDSALVLGPLMHHFKWALNDYDRLAAGKKRINAFLFLIFDCMKGVSRGILSNVDVKRQEGISRIGVSRHSQPTGVGRIWVIPLWNAMQMVILW